MDSPFYMAGQAAGRRTAKDNQPAMEFKHKNPTKNQQDFQDGYNSGFVLEKMGVLIQVRNVHNEYNTFLTVLCDTCLSTIREDVQWQFLNCEIPVRYRTVIVPQVTCRKCGYRDN